MPGYAFASGMHHVVANGRSIVLDVGSNRYVCLPAACRDALVRWRAGEMLGEDDAKQLGRLVSAGIMMRSEEPRHRRACVLTVAERDYGAAIVPGDGRRHVAAVLAQLLLARAQLRFLPLGSILAQIRSRGPGPVAVAGAPSRATLAAALEASNLYLSAHDHCLSRAIAMRRLLDRSGHRSELVFGVAGNPFKAHCWVQSEGVAITDAVDHLRNFTPILVL